MLLPSCRKGEVPSSPSTDAGQNQTPGTDDKEEEAVQVRFTSFVSIKVKDGYTTRAPIEENVLPPGAEVGIYGVKANSSNWNEYGITDELQAHLNNDRYTVQEDNSMKPDYIAEYPKKDSGYDGLVFYAYYPYSDKTKYNSYYKSYLVPVTIKMNDMASTEDYLYAERKEQLTPTDNTPVTLFFKHALGRVRFLFKNTPSKAMLYSVAVTADSPTSGYMKVDTGEILYDESDKVSTTFTYNVGEVGKDLAEGDVVVDFMLFPGANITKIECNINSIFESYPLNLSKPIELEAGVIVPVEITFTPLSVGLDNQLDEWKVSTSDDMKFGIDEETGTVTQN